jgi:hypothetical protein
MILTDKTSNEKPTSSQLDNKENDTPDLEDFGGTKSCTCSSVSDVTGSSPTKESPSRRKRLMGSLRRSMSSLRIVGSPSSKEQGQPRVDCAVEPEVRFTWKSLDHHHTKSVLQSPSTPVRSIQIRPSLALNFEESPPDQPMFNFSRPHRRSDSSSMEVHQSSPVPIPTPAQQDNQMHAMVTQPCDLPAGTVPNSPTPFRLALESDLKRFGNTQKPSPVRSQVGESAAPLPTPMPGTNIGFSADDLASDSLKLTSSQEGSSYFDVPVADKSDQTQLTGAVDEIQQSANIPALQDSLADRPTTDHNSMGPAPSKEAEQAPLHGTGIRRCDPSVEIGGNNHALQHLHAPSSGADRVAYSTIRRHEVGSSDQSYSSMDIEHVVFEDFPIPNVADRQPAEETDETAQAEAKMGPRRQAQLCTPAYYQPRTAEYALPEPAPNAWVTHKSLYDGTGYRDDSSSISPTPPTTSAAPKAPMEFRLSTVYTVDPLAEDSAAMAHDHETLEEVIRAYAAFEEGASGISEEMSGEIVAEAQADVELANTMADHSLGA